MDTITIHGLTADQKKMMDRIWAIDSNEEFEDFVDSLTTVKRQQVFVLCLMMQHEYLEEDLSAMDRYPDAEALIKRVRNLNR